MDLTNRDDLRRLMFATTNLRYLQGLGMLPIGALMLVFPLLGHLSVSHGKIAFVGLLAALALTAIATKQISRFYYSHYGKAEPDKNWFLVLSMCVWGAVFLQCIILDEGRPKFSLAALWLAAFFYGLYMSSAGYRWHYLVATACFAYLVPHWGELGESLRTAIIGVAFILGGVMDHLLLTRFLPSSPKEPISSVV